jgi:FKBP-type peptidyl-prolyl cis-trans isomerase FklB
MECSEKARLAAQGSIGIDKRRWFFHASLDIFEKDLSMRYSIALLLLLFVFVSAGNAQELVPPEQNAKPTEHGSYMVGFDVGGDLAKAGFSTMDLNSNDFLMGIMDALRKQNSRLTEAETDAALQKIRQLLEVRQKEMEAQRQAMAKKNLEVSTAFLEANKKKTGVVALPSGLQYAVVKTGNGKSPTATSSVSVHYEGSLISGKVFDSSIKRGAPLEIDLRNVIDGWKEAVPKMKVGDKWRLFIPPNLGYREQGTPDGAIGPNEALIFDIELLDVK